MDKKILGVVLSGGKSSRMGENKALLSYKNKSLLQNSLDLLKEIKDVDICISGDLVIEGVKSIPDIKKFSGPVGGIYSALSYALDKHDYLVFIPVDMPLLDSEIIRKTIRECEEYELCYYDQYYFPLCLKISEEIRDELFESTETSFSIKGMIEKLDSNKLVVDKEEEKSFKNINTVNDFKSLLENEN